MHIDALIGKDYILTEQNLDRTEKRKKVICDLVEDSLYVPMKEKELAILLRVEPEDREELSHVLKSLLEKRKIQIMK